MCPKCHAIYDFESCSKMLPDGTLVSKNCWHVQYPNHQQLSRRKACGTELLQKVRYGTQYKLKPKKVYCYNSLKASVERLAKREGFMDKCEEWRSRTSSVDLLTDVCDGQIWRDFQVVDRHPFLKQPFSWAVTLNVDWFQLFTHVCDSMGAIYLVIQNLPRSERYKWKNMILVGLIPGSKGAKVHN